MRWTLWHEHHGLKRGTGAVKQLRPWRRLPLFAWRMAIGGFDVFAHRGPRQAEASSSHGSCRKAKQKGQPLTRQELLKQLEAIVQLLSEAIAEEASSLPLVHGLSTFDRAQLNEDMIRDPYVVLLLDAHDQLVLLCKQLEKGPVSE